ncbi:MAG: hypothetical protein EBZ48_01525 [Proteobacteria bacterium]|nr:hypothetical protein [Pseudomonadota bacterium]
MFSGPGSTPSHSAPDPGDGSELLRRIGEIGTSRLESEDMERCLGKVLRGAATQVADIIGRYQVFADFTDKTESVVFVQDATGSPHKYIIASDSDGPNGAHTFLIAIPIQWTPMHADILTRLRAAVGEGYRCLGGGWIELQDKGQLLAYGESGQFGAGDHEQARKAFTRAVMHSAEGQ